MLRVAFAGTPEFAVPTLRALAHSPHALVGVLTQPDRPAGRGREFKASPVKRLALELALPIAQPAGLQQPAALDLLAQWAPEVLVVVAYGLILPPALLALPRLGGINIHASLLPRWRGAAPIQRAILAGDEQTGITIMQIEAGLDTGAILAQQLVPIDAAANSQQLHDQLSQLGADLLLATLQLAEDRQLHPKAQPDQGVSYAAKIDKAEARIDWWRSALEIDRQVRAFTPWPVAETAWHGQQLRVWEARPVAGTRVAGAHDDFAQPGNILGVADEQLLVQCGQGRIGLMKLQLAGRRIVSAREFASAQSLAGSRFG
jgi:methionyl-tRNA formyltransferase